MIGLKFCPKKRWRPITFRPPSQLSSMLDARCWGDRNHRGHRERRVSVKIFECHLFESFVHFVAIFLSVLIRVIRGFYLTSPLRGWMPSAFALQVYGVTGRQQDGATLQQEK